MVTSYKQLIVFIFLVFHTPFHALAFLPSRGPSEPECKFIGDIVNKSTEDEYVASLVYQIADIVGLRPQFLLCGAEFEGVATSTNRQGQPAIIYDKKTFGGMRLAASTNWGALAILSHEIGHHLLKHPENNTSSVAILREQELEADEFTGYVLGKLGASHDDAVHVFLTLSSDEHSKESPFLTHPLPEARVEAASRGWRKAQYGLLLTEELVPIWHVTLYYCQYALEFLGTVLGGVATLGGAVAAISGVFVWLRRRRSLRKKPGVNSRILSDKTGARGEDT